MWILLAVIPWLIMGTMLSKADGWSIEGWYSPTFVLTIAGIMWVVG